MTEYRLTKKAYDEKKKLKQFDKLSDPAKLVLLIMYRNGGEMTEEDIHWELNAEIAKHGSVEAAIAEVANEIKVH